MQNGGKYQHSSLVALRGSSGGAEDAFSQGDMRTLRSRVAQAREDALVLPGPEATPEQVISQTLHLLVSRFVESGEFWGATCCSVGMRAVFSFCGGIAAAGQCHLGNEMIWTAAASQR